MRRIRNVSFLLLTVLLLGTDAEERRARIPADVAFNVEKSKHESERLAKISADDAKLIAHFKDKQEELGAICRAGKFTPLQCEQGKKLVDGRMEKTREAVAHHRTLSNIFSFYRKLITMDLNPRDELMARIMIDSVCSKALGLPDDMGVMTKMDNIAEMTRKMSSLFPGGKKLPHIKGAYEFCQEEIRSLEEFLKNSKTGNPGLTRFFASVEMTADSAKKTLEEAKLQAEKKEANSRYEDAVRRGAA